MWDKGKKEDWGENKERTRGDGRTWKKKNSNFRRRESKGNCKNKENERRGRKENQIGKNKKLEITKKLRKKCMKVCKESYFSFLLLIT